MIQSAVAISAPERNEASKVNPSSTETSPTREKRKLENAAITTAVRASSNTNTSNKKRSSSLRAKSAQAALDLARLKLRVAKERAKRKNGSINSTNNKSVADVGRALTLPLSHPLQTQALNHISKKRRISQNIQLQQKRGVSYNGNRNVTIVCNNLQQQLPPVSALMPSSASSLIISNIAQTGSAEIIYHSSIIQKIESQRHQLLNETMDNHDSDEGGCDENSALGAKDIYQEDNVVVNDTAVNNANIMKSQSTVIDVGLSSVKTVATDISTEPLAGAAVTKVSAESLAQRKLELQKELIELKLKLEERTKQHYKQKIKPKLNNETIRLNNEKQNARTSDDFAIESGSQLGYDDSDSSCTYSDEVDIDANLTEKINKSCEKTTDNGDLNPLAGLTKEELGRRKVDAQNQMDLSYWKRFVAKQERMLSDIRKQIADTSESIEECKKERHVTNTQLNDVQTLIIDLQARQSTVEDGLISSTNELLKARQQLYDAKQEAIRGNANVKTNVKDSSNPNKKEQDGVATFNPENKNK